MPILKRAAIAGPRLLTTMVALTVTLTLAAAAASLAPGASASPDPAGGVPAGGNDISWPQCSVAAGGYGLPGPTAGAGFVVIGLTDGGSMRANPCLGRQVAAAKARHLWTGAYAMATFPTHAQLARYGGRGSMVTRLRRVGWAQAQFNEESLRRVGLRVPMVWIDVEPSRVKWSTNHVYNNAVLDGIITRYKAGGRRSGIYSYAKAWKAITGKRAMPGVPSWVPVGYRGRAAALARCAVAGYSGTRPQLVQWTDGVRDFDFTCGAITGKAATGSRRMRTLFAST